MDIKQRFGIAVRNRRKELGISQEELAMRINTDVDDSGKYADQSYISKIELGQVNVTLETADRVASALDVDISQLFGVGEG